MKQEFYGNSRVPVIDVRKGKEERKAAARLIKAANGCRSMYIPNREKSRY